MLVTLLEEPIEAQLDPGYSVATERAVRMLLSNGERVEGQVRVYRPSGRDRLSDYARAPEVFRYVETADGDRHRQRRTHRGIPGDDPSMSAQIDGLFRLMCEAGASDLHLWCGTPPLVRKDGGMQPLDPAAPVLDAETRGRGCSIRSCRRRTRREFAEKHDTDFAYEIAGLARFRANIFMDRKGKGAVFRVIPSKILTAEQLGLSPAILQPVQAEQGAGAGHRPDRLGQVDDALRDDRPHQPARATITSSRSRTRSSSCTRTSCARSTSARCTTTRCRSRARCARRCARIPDIILVGEMRDLETVAIAIETAETGHLVFGTLHTTTAASTVDRVIDQFPADRQAQIRVMLSESLKGVISQTLCKKIGGGRVAALEVLIVTSAISNLIREAKTFQIQSMMQVGKAVGHGDAERRADGPGHEEAGHARRGLRQGDRQGRDGDADEAGRARSAKLRPARWPRGPAGRAGRCRRAPARPVRPARSAHLSRSPFAVARFENRRAIFVRFCWGWDHPI